MAINYDNEYPKLLQKLWGAEAKVQELEEQLDLLLTKPAETMEKVKNIIKLEGIDEMLDEIPWHVDEIGLDYVYLFSINDYIAKRKEANDERKDIT